MNESKSKSNVRPLISGQPYTEHAAAKATPKMSDDEVRELSEDIKKNGLHQPVVMWLGGGSRQLIDGRHRMEACQLAKVDAPLVEFVGTEEEVVAFVVSANLNRRHMSKGQRAMAAVMLDQVSIIDDLRKAVGVSFGSISQARQVFKASPDKAYQVLNGEVALAEAHTQATKVLDIEDVKALEESNVAYHENEVAERLEKVKDLEAQADEIRLTPIAPPTFTNDDAFEPVPRSTGGLNVEELGRNPDITQWIGDIESLVKNPPNIDDIEPGKDGWQELSARMLEAYLVLLVEKGHEVTTALMEAVEQATTLRSIQ